MKLRRAAIVIVLLALSLLVGMRFYAQYRHVDVYVSRNAPMPSELATELHMTEHKINPVVQIASPYENAQDKVLSPDEIRQIRSKLAWSKSTPILIDALYIHSTNLVSTRRSTRRYLEECQLAKENNEWVIKSGTRTDIQNVKTFE